MLVITTGCSNKKTSSKASNSPAPQNQQLTAEDLRNAALRGQTATVRRAIEQGIKAQAADSSGQTALMLAAFNGHSDIIRYLLDEGSSVNTANTEGRTPLMFAASGPFPESVQLLLDAGADVNAMDTVEQWSALMFAAAEGQTEVVRILLTNRADPSLKDKDGETALDFAQNNNHSKVISLLQNKGSK